MSPGRSDFQEIAARLASVRARIAAAERAAGRAAGSAQLLAVSKTATAAAVLAAARAGQRAFGESRIQEADPKIRALAALEPGDSLEWHGIGRLQRNKARRAVELFDWIHSVDRLDLAHELDRHARALGRRPKVLLQVNIDEESQKGGAAPGDVVPLAHAVDALPGLEFVGLMAIPRSCEDPEQVRPSFARLRVLLGRVNESRVGRPPLGELSMGMSHDFEIAIQEGATWIRIGTALFGERER